VKECRVEPARPKEQLDQSRVGFRSGKLKRRKIIKELKYNSLIQYTNAHG
jgi:hypothetical protein